MQYILLSTLIVSGVAFRQQSVGVKGRLLCGDQPLTGAIIRLINHKTFGNIFPIVIHDSGKAFIYRLKFYGRLCYIPDYT